MCGITGVVAFSEKGKSYLDKVKGALPSLKKRGPDGEGFFTFNHVALGHTRLAIIDTTSNGLQPFTDTTGRYTIVFNGEFFNFKEYRAELEKKGFSFKSESDTEVLLNLYVAYGPDCLNKINGFFAFAIFDKAEQSLFIARDRMGVKPLLYFQDEDKLIFASEMKTLMSYGIPKEIDKTSLLTYLHLNYIPAPDSIFKKVKKLLPGTYLTIKTGVVHQKKYYEIPDGQAENRTISYGDAKFKLRQQLEEAVRLRLISDVPLGAFLSGGIDSSVVVALAAKHTKNLNTFSIGFSDEPLFDETRYAELVAKKHKTNHTVFSLTNEDLFANLHSVLEYLDEPFADSSALAVYILSKQTRKQVTVALSGDGADEMFAGYNKHKAEYALGKGGFTTSLLKYTLPFWEILPKSRNSKWGNRIRQLKKFSQGASLAPKERYWQWAGFFDGGTENHLLETVSDNEIIEYERRKINILKRIGDHGNMNDYLRTDMDLVLPNDMLTKVDMMSMANGLEVRTPFLDVNVVNFAFSLPVEYKIDRQLQKKILKDAFRNELPEELYKRGKKGFEVPLLKWFRTELKSMITDDLLSDSFIEEQGLFKPVAIRELKEKLFSGNIDDAVARVWGLIVFQYWWKKNMMS